jgi:hypothetical protein
MARDIALDAYNAWEEKSTRWGSVMVYRARPYNGKIRRWSLILFLFSIALIITLDLLYGPGAFPRWFVIFVVTLVIASGLVYTACILYDWWAWLRNKGF